MRRGDLASARQCPATLGSAYARSWSLCSQTLANTSGDSYVSVSAVLSEGSSPVYEREKLKESCKGVPYSIQDNTLPIPIGIQEQQHQRSAAPMGNSMRGHFDAYESVEAKWHA